jgi:glucokinase
MSAAPDPPALISQMALEAKAAICDQALTLFVSVFGAETGNCALHYMSTGGIFIGGSIAAKIVPKMKNPVFLESFLDKGRMEVILKDMPIKIVANDDTGLIGAARYTLIQKAFRKETKSA